jgi:FkbM family methyltransferase
MVFMSRVAQAVTARQTMGEDFFGGWEEQDVELFRRFASPSYPIPGKITDFMGIRTSTEFHPWAPHCDNVVMTEVPIPDDGLRAEAIEYFAFFDALQRSNSDSFAMAEIGSSYAPWTCAAAVCARRLGKTSIRLTAVEASSYLFSLIPQHLRENDIDPESIRLINGAAAAERTTLYFPKITSPADNGSQTSESSVDKDYRDLQVESEEVQAYPLTDLLPEGLVDLVHVDVQGHEHGVLRSARDTLNERVRAVFVGTHARAIEGQLLELFKEMGWHLHRERPTRFQFMPEHEDLVAWTTRDGGQYWRNPSL